MKYDSSDKEVCNTCLEYAADYIESHGIKGEILECNGYKSYVATVGSGERTLIYNGHLDVVSGKPGQFEPFEKDGKLYGRGSADMKGGCAPMIHAFIALSKMNIDCKVMIQLVTDEEIGGMNGSKYLVDQGYLGDFVICTEPTQMKPSIQSKGIIRMKVITEGVPAHGSRPWEGDNAIVKAYENYERIQKLPILNIGSDFYDHSTANLAVIKGGDIYNRVPDQCDMGFDIRYVPDLDPKQIIEDIKSVVEGRVHVKSVDPGVNVQADDKILAIFKPVVEDVLGHSVDLAAQHGGSDARFFSEKGIPAIEFGPRGDGWHGDEECVDISSMDQLEEILIEFAKVFK